MKLTNLYFNGLEFDGQLVEGGSKSAWLECRIRPPLFGGDIAEVEVRVPNYGEYFGGVFNPLKIHGLLGRLWVELDNVFYRSCPISGGGTRKTGSKAMQLSHVGLLKIVAREKAEEDGRDANIVSKVIFHLTKNEYFGWLSGSNLAGPLPSASSEVLASLSLPKCGNLSITREWIYTQLAHETHGAARWGLCAELNNLELTAPTLDTCSECLNDALLVLSLLTRQRLAILGTEATYYDRFEQTWQDPLDPLNTKHFPIERKEHLVDSNKFESIANRAIEKLYSLTPDLKEACKAMLIGLTPYIPMKSPDRFLSMFQALEGCRRFARAECHILGPDDIALVEILEKAKLGASPSIVERLNGFIRRINGKTPSLKVELQSVLSDWDVATDDIWPVSGTAKLPGLIQMRDKLVHSGPLALRFHALAHAERHLSILLERTILRILEIPLDETNAAPSELEISFRFHSEYMLHEQRTAFDPDVI